MVYRSSSTVWKHRHSRIASVPFRSNTAPLQSIYRSPSQPIIPHSRLHTLPHHLYSTPTCTHLTQSGVTNSGPSWGLLAASAIVQ
ncbi:hypothetical protein XELAEV_18005981mg [Xenopus laevis]|uniref:Uncharacterized protein n=1 Tax=Xenopus laevis TaxID=8355 RepID=A0A974I3R2_XENLA|nr:hypothetical protein XELAEV_18005981mg [Xenopus laevis]